MRHRPFAPIAPKHTCPPPETCLRTCQLGKSSSRLKNADPLPTPTHTPAPVHYEIQAPASQKLTAPVHLTDTWGTSCSSPARARRTPGGTCGGTAAPLQQRVRGVGRDVREDSVLPFLAKTYDTTSRAVRA
eukprot:365034-Chlamydomonas_euryale.AAC.1